MKDVAVFLYDLTGVMAEPWLQAGFVCVCVCVDLQHPPGWTQDGNLFRIGADLRGGFDWLDLVNPNRIAFVAAFPPCDHLAVSGARWFKGKGLRKLSLAVDLFATAAEFCESSGAPYIIENPVSTISTYWRKPDHTFQPHHFTRYCAADNYTKATCLWVGGGFVMPPPAQLEGFGKPDDRIHKCPPGPERHNIRSATPRGFSLAVFESNACILD